MAQISRPAYIWKPSPNFKVPLSPRKISCVVIHATATHRIESPAAWLCDPIAKASAHYLIGLDGKILYLVEEKNIAWHAGISSWRGVPNVNNFSIGIELVNPNDGQTPYPYEQVRATVDLCVPICKENGIKSCDVIGHADVAPGRKNDPLAFVWDEFRTYLRGGGIDG